MFEQLKLKIYKSVKTERKSPKTEKEPVLPISDLGHVKERLLYLLLKTLDSRWQFELELHRKTRKDKVGAKTPDHVLSKVVEFPRLEDGKLKKVRVLLVYILDSKLNPKSKTRNEICEKYYNLLLSVVENKELEYDLTIPMVGVVSLLPGIGFEDNNDVEVSTWGNTLDIRGSYFKVQYQSTYLIESIIEDSERVGKLKPELNLSDLFITEGLTPGKLKVLKKTNNLLKKLESIYRYYRYYQTQIDEQIKISNKKQLEKILNSINNALENFTKSNQPPDLEFLHKVEKKIDKMAGFMGFSE